jgi:hypothetical protein
LLPLCAATSSSRRSLRSTDDRRAFQKFMKSVPSCGRVHDPTKVGSAAAASSRSWTRQAPPLLADHARRAEFLGPMASVLSRRHAEHPTSSHGRPGLWVDYLRRSPTRDVRGNSNWRGPVWIPVNMLIRALVELYAYLRRRFTVECPTGSGGHLTSISRRGDRTPLDRHLSQGREGRAPRSRRITGVPGRPALARSRPLLRVLPRRHGAGWAPATRPAGRASLPASCTCSRPAPRSRCWPWARRRRWWKRTRPGAAPSPARVGPEYLSDVGSRRAARRLRAQMPVSVTSSCGCRSGR